MQKCFSGLSYSASSISGRDDVLRSEIPESLFQEELKKGVCFTWESLPWDNQLGINLFFPNPWLLMKSPVFAFSVDKTLQVLHNS
jgi:hypothetical protein